MGTVVKQNQEMNRGSDEGSNLETAVANTTRTANENKYQGLFEIAPVALWEQDFSDVKKYIDNLRLQGVSDFQAYFDTHPEDVTHGISLIKVKNLNQSTLNLYRATCKTELVDNLDKVLGSESVNLIKEELILIAENATFFEAEGVNRTLEGDLINVIVRWSVSPGFEETFEQVIVSIFDVTAQKKAESQLRIQATAIESAANAIVITNTEGEILWVNPAFTKLTGYTFEEAIGQNPRILKSGENDAEFYATLWETIVDGDTWQCEEMINRRKDGSLYYEHMVITPVKDEQGRVVRYIAIKEDITERKQMELQLRRQLQEEELLRQIGAVLSSDIDVEAALNQVCTALADFFQAPIVSLALLDPETMITDIIGAFLVPELNHSGKTVMPLPALVPTDLFLQQDIIYIADVHEAIQFKAAQQMLEPFDNKAALLVPIKVAAPFQGMLTIETLEQRLFGDEDRELIEQVAASISQALQRVQAEQQVQKGRDFAQQVMETLGQGLVILHADWSIEYCNPAFANLMGQKVQALVNRSFRELIVKDDLENMAPMTQAEYQAQKSIREFRLIQATGDEVDVMMTAVPRENDFDRGGVTCVVADLTAQKKLASSLAEARDRAIETSQLKSEFLANMSHEIRTPLNAIIGMTTLLLDSPLTIEQLDFTQTIRNSGEVLLSLINDILDFSKIEAGKLELEKRPFTLRDCVEEALDVVVTKASEKGLELAYCIDSDVPNEALGDVTRVRQILVNLLNNAIKFTDAGEVVLKVSRCQDCDKVPTDFDTMLQFSVQDTGIGISPENLNRLFKSFSQVDASTTRKYGGTGLGLAISRQLVEMMGGQIWVESEYSKGSTFYFTIATTAIVSHRRVYVQNVATNLLDKRLLIVDDNETNCKILLKQAELWGMKPQAVYSGEEAVALLHQDNQFDVVIVDIQMPGMDGIMLASEIRKQYSKQSLPLVMLSSIGDRAELKRNTHFSAFLTKPVKQQLLFESLVAALSETAVRAVAKPQTTQLDPEMGQRHPLRILLAEDNLINQKVALRILERMDYQADVANNGLEVLERLQQKQYDVVFMDVQMPLMDGVSATEQIRDIWPPEEQPYIIAMTANALSGDREKYLAAGMDEYISKPIRIQELMAALAGATPHLNK